MKDRDNRVIKLGDRVKLWENHFGRVVCDFDAKRFSQRYPETEWGYLKIGVLVEAEDGSLFHYERPDEDFELISA
jgi:hypothetical protein